MGDWEEIILLLYTIESTISLDPEYILSMADRKR